MYPLLIRHDVSCFSARVIRLQYHCFTLLARLLVPYKVNSAADNHHIGLLYIGACHVGGVSYRCTGFTAAYKLSASSSI